MKAKIIAALKSATFVSTLSAGVVSALGLLVTQNLINDTLEQSLAGLAVIIIPALCAKGAIDLSGSKAKAKATGELAAAQRDHTAAIREGHAAEAVRAAAFIPIASTVGEFNPGPAQGANVGSPVKPPVKRQRPSRAKPKPPATK